MVIGQITGRNAQLSIGQFGNFSLGDVTGELNLVEPKQYGQTQ